MPKAENVKDTDHTQERELDHAAEQAVTALSVRLADDLNQTLETVLPDLVEKAFEPAQQELQSATEAATNQLGEAASLLRARSKAIVQGVERAVKPLAHPISELRSAQDETGRLLEEARQTLGDIETRLGPMQAVAERTQTAAHGVGLLLQSEERYPRALELTQQEHSSKLDEIKAAVIDRETGLPAGILALHKEQKRLESQLTGPTGLLPRHQAGLQHANDALGELVAASSHAEQAARGLVTLASDAKAQHRMVVGTMAEQTAKQHIFDQRLDRLNSQVEALSELGQGTQRALGGVRGQLEADRQEAREALTRVQRLLVAALVLCTMELMAITWIII